jgi:dipeptidyl aminopeptidase/acylaminoacyl peptidase
MHSSNRLGAAVLLALASGSAFATIGNDNDKPLGTPTTPAETFAKHPEYQGATLSPTGAYVAVTTPFEERRVLSIIKLSGNYDTNVIKFAKHQLVSNATWVDDDRLVVEKAHDVGFLDQPVTTGEWFATDADASHQVQLFGYIPDEGSSRGRLKDEGWASLMTSIEGTDGNALFYFRPWQRTASKVSSSMYRVDTRSGKREEIESYKDNVAFISDRSGKARFMQSMDIEGKQFLRYRRQPGDDWTEVPATIAGKWAGIYTFEPDNQHFYAAISDKGEPASLYRVSILDGTRERIAGNPDLEVASMYSTGYGSAPYAVTFEGGRPKIDFVDPKSEWSQLHAGLMKAFPGQLVDFEGVSKDKNTVLYYVYSDRHPGAYYLFDRKSSKSSLLFESRPWIDPAKMAPMQPVEFRNRKGEKLFGYYTAPLGKQGALPLVVMPHGGPVGPYDKWGYNADVQYLASLGYAVLQVNYRGSGARGSNFQEAGWKGWGTNIQDDITDGVQAMIAQGMANKDKICIYGASFGGYSALMNPIRNPGMYKCAIGYAGVYDLGIVNDEEDGSKRGRAWIDRELGAPETYDAQSPARHADQVDVPVLLIHGRDDMIATYENYSRMKNALEKAGKPFESLVKNGEGHGFYNERNQVEVYERMAAFLKKYNPAD